ncbi:MAG: hypothetical protein QM205_02435, partial [Bacillota bacterium]|nr:hypothetical protein [Bacillota bacterium]
GDTWTIEQRIVNIYAELNNRYTKAQTYSNAEIEQRITDLLGLTNLQDTAVEFSAGVYDLSYNGLSVSPFAYSLVSPYNWVILQVLVGTQAEYTIFKPSVSTNGVGINLPLTQKDVYAEIKRNGSNFEFSLKKKNDNTLDTTTATIKAWGIKLDGIDASDISYNNETVESALDSLLVPEYITATHEALQTEITATNDFEINDETGDVIKITGNEPTQLLTNPNFGNGTTGWVVSHSSLSVSNGILTITPLGTANYAGFQQNIQLAAGEDFYTKVRIRATTPNIGYVDFLMSAGGNKNYLPTIYNLVQNQWYEVSGIYTPNVKGTQLKINGGKKTTITNEQFVDERMEVDYHMAYNITDFKKAGVKNDAGIPFAQLTNEEIKEQLDIWFENGFPTVVEKLVSKSDNLFNAEFNTLSSLDSENLIPNSDLILDSNSDGIPDGFGYNSNTTDKTLVNGIAKFTATAAYSGLYKGLSNQTIGDIHYHYARIKTDAPAGKVILGGYGGSAGNILSNDFQFISRITNPLTSAFVNAVIQDTRTTDYTPIEVDYMGVINITDLVSRGILPSGLTNNEYKEMIDKALFDNVPLRETDYIVVEPSKAYKLIKVSANEVTHKVIEYTTDNQVVKVTPVVYTTNKFTFTTHALTSKIKLVSDLIDRPNKVISNSDFSDGVGWYASKSSNTIVGGNLVNTGDGTHITPYTYISNKIVNVGMDIYTKARIKVTNSVSTEIRIYWYDSTNAKIYIIDNPIYTPSENTWYEFSDITSFTANGSANIRIYHKYADAETSNGKVMEVDYVITYNITDFKKAGVVNDSGTLFSRLTNDEIKDQMDIWTEVGFPDHVIAALYPDGVDSAIALKYNDADDIFRPQQIDELPLNLTLRSGEYWQDGYVVKQNGNAEYHPLDTKFSAWNYGQLEAVYTSGIPADFDIQYAQNTAAQVKTTQEFLVEAREQIDYVTEGYDSLVEKLGDAIFSDKYNSFAGITSDTYEYYTLEGIKEGNTLAIEGAGQSIQNLLGKGGTINSTITTRGVTVTYDSVTGVFTANGTATAGAAFNITLATGMDFDLPVGTPMQLMRYYDSGTVDLNGSYIGYVLVGTSASNRINENSEALYDPYINGSGNLKPDHATDKQYLVFQCWAPGITFNNFKFKIGIYEGLQLRPFILPSGVTAKSNVTIYNRTANKLNMPTALDIEDSGLTITYDPLVQEFLLSGTATATKDISLNATFNVLSGDRFSIKRLYQSGDVTAAGGTLPRLKLVNSTNTTIVYNDIYKMTAPEGQTPTPDVSFNTGTAPADDTLTLKLGITSGQVFDNYRFRLMIHDKSTDIGYVAYRRELLGNMSVGANERAVIEFKAI